MSSGLQSIRDKVLLYFERRLLGVEPAFTHLYQIANALAEEIRRVRTEDEKWLSKSDLSFDMQTILGGQMAEDMTSKMFLIYPDGTWIEVTEGTPYVIIGQSSYGKPVLDRAWRFSGRLEEALTIGLLAFDATCASSGDVGPPIDTLLCRDGSYLMREHRFSSEDLAPLSARWSGWIARGVAEAKSVSAALFDALAPAMPQDRASADGVTRTGSGSSRQRQK